MACLTHIALHVKDVGSCVDFYQNFVGLHLVKDRIIHDKHIIWLVSAEPFTIYPN